MRVCKWVWLTEKHDPPHMCYRTEIGRSVWCEHKLQENPKIGERWNSAVLGWECVADRKVHAPLPVDLGAGA